MGLWTCSASLQDRIRYLRQGLLALDIVHDDGAVDIINVSSGPSWILAGANDVLNGRNRNTVVDLVSA
jgi:hypothetical protein